MKNPKLTPHLKGLLLLALLTFFYSCSKEDLQKDEQNQENVNDITYHRFMINGNETIIREQNGGYFFSDCEVLSERQFNLLKRLSNDDISTIERSTINSNFVQRWPNGTVFYSLDGIQNQNKKNTIISAMQHISNSVPGVNFIQRTNQPNFILFQDDPFSNASFVGMQGGSQTIWLADNNMGVSAHEILHALGIFHEQSRPDRGNFVNIHLGNVSPGSQHNFNLVPASIPYGNFDFGSIMIYGSYYFSNNGLPTMTRISGNPIIQSQNNALSIGDIAGLKALYPSINGNQSFCSTSQYSLDQSFNDATISWSWSASPSGQVSISNPNSPTATLTKVVDGLVTLTATITRNGQSFTVNRQIYVGAPAALSANFNTTGYSGPLDMFNCLKNPVGGGAYEGTINLPSPPPGSTLSLEVIEKASPSTVVNILSEGGYTRKIRISPQSHHAVIKITLTNSCGSYSSNHYFIANGTCYDL